MRRGPVADLELRRSAGITAPCPVPPAFATGLADFWRWTGDRDTTGRLLPHATAALAWATRSSERHPDGLLATVRQAPRRTAQPGLEGLRGGRPRTGRQRGAAGQRAGGGAGPVVPGAPRGGDAHGGVRRPRGRRRESSSRSAAPRGGGGPVLDARGRHLRDGDRCGRGDRAVNRLQPGAPARRWPAGRRPRPGPHGPPVRPRPLDRLGRADALRGPRRVQPVRVSPGDRVAGRLGGVRRGLPPLRVPPGAGGDRLGAVRRRRPLPPAPAAGAVCRARRAGRGRPDQSIPRPSPRRRGAQAPSCRPSGRCSGWTAGRTCTGCSCPIRGCHRGSPCCACDACRWASATVDLEFERGSDGATRWRVLDATGRIDVVEAAPVSTGRPG